MPGRQLIPRPPGVQPGGLPPWSAVPAPLRALTLADVRDRCRRLPEPEPLPVGPGSRSAAVLLPFFEEAGEARLVFTKRPDTMPHHRGEIVFPGGKVDPALDPAPRDAALREAKEEVGLEPALVDVLAELDHISTFAGAFTIVPFVGVVDTGRPALAAHPREVVRVFDVAVAELLDDATFREEHWETPGAARSMYFYELEDETVWGATARILTGLLAHLTGTAEVLGRSW